jgi:putative FmdB family regulatory protein
MGYCWAMPIYEFQCEKCGAESEILVPNTHWEGTPCPKCGSTQLVKKLSVFAAAASEESAPSCDPSSCCTCPHRHMH